MQVQVDPKLFHEFYFKMVLPMKLPITSQRVIEEFVDIDVNSEVVSKIIHQNQYVEQLLLQEIKALGLKENTPSLKAAIVLMGMQGVRNFVCALQVLRRVLRTHPKAGKNGKLELKISDYLKYSVRGEEFVHNHNMQYADSAFAAGLMFDVLAYIGREHFKADKTFDEYVAEVFKHGLKAARVGTELAKSFKNLGFSKYVFGACLIHDIGKLVMELLYPPSTDKNSFAKFREDMTKAPLSRDVIHFMEIKRFGLPHEYYGAQLAYIYEPFKIVERAILFHHDPYIIRQSNKDLYSLACIIALSTNMASHFRIPKDGSDPIYKAWITPELKDFKVDPKLLKITMSKIGNEMF